MKYISAIIMICTTVVSLNAQDAAKLFDEKCVMCHIKTKPAPEIRDSFVAPPIFGVMRHVKDAFPDDRNGAIAFIQDYVMNPSAEQAKCLPKSIQRFGLMPSQKGMLTDNEMALIAEYIYDNFPPTGFIPKNRGGK